MIKKILLVLNILFLSTLYAQNFNGSTSYIDIGDSVLTGVRTIEMWVKPNDDITSTSLSDFQAPLHRSDSMNNNKEVAFAFDKKNTIHAGKFRFKLNNASGVVYEVYSNNNNWNKNQWYHIAVVIDSVDGIMLFVDGVKQIKVDNGWKLPILSSSNPASIGRQGYESASYFDGHIDEVRLSTNARYIHNFIPKCTYINDIYTKALYKLDTLIGNSTPDSSSNGYDGTVSNVSLSKSEPCVNQVILPQKKSQVFNGVDSYIDVGNNVLTGVRTIEMWVKPSDDITTTSLSDFQAPFHRSNSMNNNKEVAFAFDKANTIYAGHFRFKLNDQNGNLYHAYSDSNNWTKGQWYHIAVSIDSINGIMLFVDGLKQNSMDSTWKSPIISSLDPASIGRQGNESASYFNGSIDNVRLSTIARYTQNFTPDCDFKNDIYTKALYDLDTTIGVITPDSSLNGYNGAVYGTVYDSAVYCNNIPTLVKSIKYTNDKILFYPNPAKDNLTVVGKVGSMKIIDMTGKVISEKNGMLKEVNSFDISTFKNGIYFVYYSDLNGKIATFKFVKN